MKNSLLLVSLFTLSAVASPEYKGSSFNEVLDVIEGQHFTPRTEIENQEWQAYNAGLPHYEVLNFKLSEFSKTLEKVKAASKRTLEDKVDYYDRLEKLVHANGVCVSGLWEITSPSKYTGYFSQGQKALFIGRVSSALGGTLSGERRSFGFAGKLFPTLNPNEVVNTVNFFTIDVLSGTKAGRFLDVSLSNNPSLHPNFEVLKPLSIIIPAFKSADSSGTFRPVTAIAQVGVADLEAQSPVFMRLQPDLMTRKVNRADFRDEVVESVSVNDRKLVFNIEVANESAKSNADWTRLGQITLDKAVVSYGCDRRLHFAHPKDDKSNQKK